MTQVVFEADLCGAGDVIMHAWHAEGYRSAGRECLFYAKRHDRIELLTMLGQQVTQNPTGAIKTGGHADHYAYELRIDKGNGPRGEVWASQLPGNPKVLRPTVTIKADEQARVDDWIAGTCLGRPLALLFPFANFKTREWPTKHFSDLAYRLQDAGFYVCAMGADGSHAERLGAFPFYFYGTRWNHVAAMMTRAAICVGNDSGPAHLAGTLDVPFVAVMGPTRKVFDHMPSIVEMRVKKEEVGCVGCHFNGDRGFRRACDFGCSALMALRPETVAENIIAAQKLVQSMETARTNNA